MSELMNTQNAERGFRWRLLTTVSALALLASVAMRDAKAADDDTDRPTVWIELGGAMDHVTGQGNPFTPGFLSVNHTSSVLQDPSPAQAQNPPPFSFGGDGKISFEPQGFDWVFSASIRYGRSSNNKEVDHQTKGIHYDRYLSGVPQITSLQNDLITLDNFADTKIAHHESNAIVDFQAGKDVGLGLFGRDSSSVLSLGVRFAQFSSDTTFDVRARPDLQFKYVRLHTAYPNYDNRNLPHFHSYHATGNASRSFRGIGPSLSLNGSTPFVGNSQNGELTVDWGANAAILFGKQKAHVRHQETGLYKGAISATAPIYEHPLTGHDTDRAVIVPNVGGFAGASWRMENFKVSLGYRADFFFGAMDVGIDARKSETLGFYGPFASVSVGIGG